MQSTTLSPQPHVMTIWRVLLACALFPLAFLFSVVFALGSFLWNLCAIVWVFVFLFFYLVYFPIRFERLALRIDDAQFVFTSGVFEHRVRCVPFVNVEFATLSTSPLHRLWGLSSLVLVSPGGRVRMSGLRTEDAQRVIDILFDGDLPGNEGVTHG